MIVDLKASVYAHADILSALFLALREGVRYKLIHPDVVEPLVNLASHSDCNVSRKILEAVLKEMRGTL